MQEVFEGQIIKLAYKSDIIEVITESVKYYLNEGVFTIPTLNLHSANNFMIIKYFTIKKEEERKGLLRYKELNSFPIEHSELLSSETFEVLKPLEYKIEDGYLEIDVNINLAQKYRIESERGALIQKKNNLYKFMGNPSFVFITENIIYKFGGPQKHKPLI